MSTELKKFIIFCLGLIAGIAIIYFDPKDPFIGWGGWVLAVGSFIGLLNIEYDDL